MNKSFSTLLKFLLFLSIGILLIWLSVRHLTDEQIEQSKDAIQRAHYGWIILSVAVGMLSHISRAVRWKMLMSPLGHNPKLTNTFYAVMIGYMSNYAINRIGEVSRCTVLTKYEKIPFAESFGTVIVERIVDTLTFLFLVILVFFMQFTKVYDYIFNKFIPELVEKYAGYQLLFYAIGGVLILGLLLLIIFRKKIIGMMNVKTKRLWDGFRDGLSAIRRLRSPGLFLFHSFFIWFIYYAMLHICFLALHETADLGLSCALTTLLFGTLTVIITPGGLGAYPIAVSAILALYLVDPTIGLAVGWLIWLSQFFSILFFGLVSLVLLPITNKEDDSKA